MPMNREQIEELLELFWTAAEDGMATLERDKLPQKLLCFLPNLIDTSEKVYQETIDVMVREGLLEADGRRVKLSSKGRVEAGEIVRRHRLTEVLLHNVLEVSDESMEQTACQVEHILNLEVTDAVCTFLGHPPACPHGRAIPRGHCCEEAVSTLASLIVPLSRLSIGDEGTVAFIHTKRHAYLQHLNAFGIAPGGQVHLRQTYPALVVQIGETELALDTDAGQEIFVRRRSKPGV